MFLKFSQPRAAPNGKKDGKKIGFNFENQRKELDRIWERSPERSRPDIHKKFNAMPNNTMLNGLFCKKMKNDESNFFPLAREACRSADFSNTA